MKATVENEFGDRQITPLPGSGSLTLCVSVPLWFSPFSFLPPSEIHPKLIRSNPKRSEAIRSKKNILFNLGRPRQLVLHFPNVLSPNNA
jgi:hypothetical protein